MTPKEQLIESLRLLCEREGGHATVADAIASSEQTLWQIVNGVKLPSGEPRGVGPNLQKRLDARYPGWSLLWRRTSLTPMDIEDTLTTRPFAVCVSSYRPESTASALNIWMTTTECRLFFRQNGTKAEA